MINERLEAALSYAARDWYVLPVLPGAKLPASQHGVHDATTDAEQIRAWWQRNPNFNVGVACGQRSGLIVFDVDPRNGGEDSWGQWVDENGGPPEGMIQCTAGGGFHYLAEYTPDLRSCKLAEGVDLLSDGRYFIAAPSVVGEREYFWDGDDQSLFAVPQTWIEAYRKRTRERTAKVTGELIEGNRNAGLTALGGGMRNIGMTESEITEALLSINASRCDVPLPDSEVRQIARSVARYEPDSDVAASVAIGSEFADSLIREERRGDFFFTPSDTFLSQPAPLQWVIRGWVPAGGLTMVYGESGVGKTFVTLDMACSIATGQEWQGHSTRPGVVVYMCGEGNYGFRLRVAAWAKIHGPEGLRNMIVSNRAIDVNPMTAPAIIREVRSVTDQPVSLVVIDTLNNHMDGDENSARDTRTLVNACKSVMSELGCAVVLNHHIGHGGAASGRARGSSAWKASLDSSILVSDAGNELVAISSTKMKDSRPPDTVHGRIEEVELDWDGEHGKETSAVFRLTGEAPSKKSEKKIDEHIRHFTNAWFLAGAEQKSIGPLTFPYLSRSAFLSYVESLGNAPSTAKKWVKPSYSQYPIGALLMAEIIAVRESGWEVICPQTSSQMLLRSKEK